MPRIRTIKPDFFTHEELSALPADTHLFAAGLLCQADDEGYFNANPQLLQGSIFPLRSCPVSAQEMLLQLAKIGFIDLGSRQDGKRFGRIAKFLVHQRINKPTRSKIKDFNIAWEHSGSSGVALMEESPNGRGAENEDSLAERNKEGNGTGNKVAGNMEEEGERGGGAIHASNGADDAKSAAVKLISALKLKPENELVQVVSSAIYERSERAGGSENASLEILNDAVQARSRGIRITGRWFEQEFPDLR